MKLVKLPVIIISLSLLGACASLGDGDGVVNRSTSPFIPIGAVAEAPRGYLEMCQHRPMECVDGRRFAANQTAPTAPGLSSPAAAPSATSTADATGALASPETLQPAIALGGDAGPTQRPLLDGAWTSTRPKMAAAVFSDAAPVIIQGRRLPISIRLRMLESVDRYVNGNVRQATDMEVYGVEEYWNRSGVGRGARGDCEDIAIEKRLQLIDQGYPPDDLVYAVVYRRDIGLHAVLVAHTEIGDLVLDSLGSQIVLWNHAPYTWVKRQSVDDPSVWNLVDMTRADQPKLRVARLGGVSTPAAMLGAVQDGR